MDHLLIQIKVNNNLYLRDPQSTELGKKIIEHSVKLIDEIGLELFTFKKLAKEIDSTEASVYRYFKNKHQLFVYLLNWYWEWMSARIDLNTLNIPSAIDRLKVVLNVIVDTANRNTDIEFVDEEILHRIVVREGTNAYHTKGVDDDNEIGFFLAYKDLCGKIANLISEVNPSFPYPRALASNLIETANNNLYFARHLPRLTDFKVTGPELNSGVKQMLEYFCFGILAHRDTTEIAAKLKLNQSVEN